MIRTLDDIRSATEYVREQLALVQERNREEADARADLKSALYRANRTTNCAEKQRSTYNGAVQRLLAVTTEYLAQGDPEGPRPSGNSREARGAAHPPVNRSRSPTRPEVVRAAGTPPR